MGTELFFITAILFLELKPACAHSPLLVTLNDEKVATCRQGHTSIKLLKQNEGCSLYTCDIEGRKGVLYFSPKTGTSPRLVRIAADGSVDSNKKIIAISPVSDSKNLLFHKASSGPGDPTQTQEDSIAFDPDDIGSNPNLDLIDENRDFTFWKIFNESGCKLGDQELMGLLEKIDTGLNSLRKKLAKVKLKQVLFTINGITSNLLLPKCKDDKKIEYTSSYNKDQMKDFLPDEHPLFPFAYSVSIETANKIHEDAANLGLENFSLLDGCYLRADLLCEKLSKEGIQSGKVWIYGKLQPNDFILWKYHVATTISVFSESVPPKVNLMVIDPALGNGPLTVDQWLVAVNPLGKIIQTQFPPAENSHWYLKSSLAYSSALPSSQKGRGLAKRSLVKKLRKARGPSIRRSSLLGSESRS